jgi:hypothetical protein
MKILEKREWTREVTCTGCKSRLEVEVGDLNVTTFCLDESGPVKVWADCPVCSQRLGIWNIPQGVMSTVYNKKYTKGS